MSGTKRAVIVLVLALLAFGYVFTLNPGAIDFKLLPGSTPITTSFALILFLFFLTGFGLAVCGTAFWEAFRSFLFWRLIKADRRKTEAKHLVLEGRGNTALGRTSIARRLLQKAQRKDPGEAYIALEAARVEMADGHLDAAEQRLRKLLTVAPRNAEILSLLLEIYRTREDFEGQVSILTRWLEVDPNHLQALRHLRDVYAGVKNWSEAVRIQARIVAKTDSREQKTEERGRLSEFRFREATALAPAQAKASLEKIIKDDEKFAPGHAALGDTFIALGDKDGAVQAWIRGYHASAKAGLLLKAESVLERQGRAEEMLKLYRKLGKKGGKPLLLRARLLLQLERAEEALRILEQDGSGIGGSRLGTFLAAEALLRLGSYDSAAKSFREAVFGRGPDVPVAFVCDACNTASLQWQSSCTHCGSVDSLRFQADTLPPLLQPPAGPPERKG